MASRSCFLALLGGALMTATAWATPGVDANWTNAVYKDANGKNQTVMVITENPDKGYDGGLGLPAVAVNNDVVFNGTYDPADGAATIKVSVAYSSTGSGKDYTPTVGNGAWSMKVAKGGLTTGSVYDVTVSATINGKSVSKTYKMNVANN